MIFIIVSIQTLFSARVRSEVFHAGLDLSLTGFYNFNVKGLTYFGFGPPGLKVGPIFLYSRPSKQTQELLYGVGATFGQSFSLQTGAALISETAYGKNSNGFSIFVIVRQKVSSVFQFTIPLVFKSYYSGNDLRRQFDFYPLIGVGVSI